MTYLPKSELVGVLAPYSINTKDIGVNWLDFGVIIPATIRTISYQGGGIVIAGGGSYIGRSVDYGKTWTNIFPAGIPAAIAIVSSVYVGSGIGLAGDGIGHIFRSTDYGVNWDLAGGARTIANAPNVASLAYIGDGIAVAGTGPAAVTGNSIFRSTDFGLNFIAQVYGPVANGIGTITYLENGIAIAGDDGGNIHRSADFGATWAPIAGNPITPDVILSSAYLGKGIVLFGTSTGNIFCSLDYGLTFPITLASGLAQAYSITYIGNGNVIVAGFDGANGRIARNSNFTLGVPFTLLSTPSAVGPLFASAYADNGVVLAGGAHIWRSDVSYKTNEATSVVDPSIISTTTSITVGQPINTVLVDATGGNITITLLPGTTFQIGHEFVIKKTDGTTNIVTITPSGGNLIDGEASRVLTQRWESVTIRTDRTGWFIVSTTPGSGIAGFIKGQLKPNVTRYAMPGWNVTRGDVSATLTVGVIYYIPFYYASTTTATEIAVDVTGAVLGSTIDLRIFNWDDGVPGALFANLGTISSASTGVKTIAISVTFPQGLYFMAMRASATVTVRANNFSFPIAGPVGAMNNSNTGSPTDFCDQFITTVTAAYADPAPAPTAMQLGFPFFLLKEN